VLPQLSEIVYVLINSPLHSKSFTISTHCRGRTPPQSSVMMIGAGRAGGISGWPFTMGTLNIAPHPLTWGGSLSTVHLNTSRQLVLFPQASTKIYTYPSRYVHPSGK